MLHLLGMKGLFGGLRLADPNKHLKDFAGVSLAYNLPGTSQERIKVRLFPFSLTGEATTFLGEILSSKYTYPT